MSALSMPTRLVLPPSAFYNMFQSAVEVFPRESDGYSFLNPQGRDLVVVRACPIQTSKRGFGQVDFGNKAAMHRLTEFERAVSMNGHAGLIRGGYHSHTVKESVSELSLGDLKFIRDELAKRENLDYWVELIITLKERFYSTPSSPTARTWQSKNKLQAIVRPQANWGYRASIGAYVVDREEHIRELKVITNGKP